VQADNSCVDITTQEFFMLSDRNCISALVVGNKLREDIQQLHKKDQDKIVSEILPPPNGNKNALYFPVGME